VAEPTVEHPIADTQKADRIDRVQQLHESRHLRIEAFLPSMWLKAPGLDFAVGIEKPSNADRLHMLWFCSHKTRQKMTKTELQIALAEATQTNKRTAALFLETLSSLAYKAIRKEGEFVLPGFGKLVKQKRKARTGINPKTQQKIKIPAKTVVKFRVAKAAKDAVLGVKK
jgi:DNA-binding protein HU-beta